MPRKLLLGFSVFLAAAAIIEGGLQFFAQFERARDLPAMLSHYRTESWAKDLWKDMRAFQQTGMMRYEPFVEWDIAPFRSEYVNIGSDSTRKTWNPEFAPGTSPKRVFVLGGSALMGVGARDEFTIPSYLSKELNAKRAAYEVKNYGQGGSTFTQEVIRLITLLRNGERPDLVIFYDGANDVLSSYGTGRPGALMFENRLRALFEGDANELLAFSMKRIVGSFWERCKLCALASRQKPSHRQQGAVSAAEEARLEKLAQGSAREYLSSLSLLDKLASAYGFPYMALWQPTLFSDDRRVGSEVDIERTDPQVEDGRLRRYAEMFREELARSAPAAFRDLSAVLDNRENGVYLDGVHIAEEGNEIVARAMADLVLRDFSH